MKRFLIHVSTNWCGMDAIYRGVADSEDDLDDIAWELAYENFESYEGVNLMAEDNGYDPETMENDDWDKLYEEVSECDYYNGYVEPFTGTDEEWEEIGGIIYED